MVFQKTVVRGFHSSRVNAALFSKAAKHLANTAPKEYVQFALTNPSGLSKPPAKNEQYQEGNTFKEMFDEKKTTERTKVLEKEFQQSGFHDLYAFEKTKGKLFTSPKTYWPQNVSKYFPNLLGQQLDTKQDVNVEEYLRGKLTVLKMSGNKVGEDMINSFFVATAVPPAQERSNYLQKPSIILDELNNSGNSTTKVQIAEINLIDNALKSFLLRVFGNTLNKSIPKERQHTYFMCNRNQLPFGTRELLNINNVYSGYVFVIDPNLKIRWMACGTASSQEFATLWDSVKAIQKEKTSK